MPARAAYGFRPFVLFALRDWIETLGRVVRGVSERNLFLASGGMAFFATLSIFPFLAFLIALYGYISDPTIILLHIDRLEAFVPPAAYDLIEGQLMSVLTTDRSGHGLTGVISIAFTLWAARAGSNALLQGLDLVYPDTSLRGFLRHTMTAVAITLTLVGVAIFALLVVVAVPVALQYLPLAQSAETIITVLTWLTGFVAMLLAIGVIYRYGPNRRGNRAPILSFGGLVAGLLWMAASTLFSYYLKSFGNYNEIYGSIGAVAALMMWFFVSSFVILLGALLNREIEQQSLVASEPLHQRSEDGPVDELIGDKSLLPPS